MFPTKKYLWILFIQNSRSYLKFLVCYVVLLAVLLEISDSHYDFSTTGLILTLLYIVSLWIVTMWTTVFFFRKLFESNTFLKTSLIYTGDSTVPNKEQNYLVSLSKDVEDKVIKSWYNEISGNAEFTLESRVLAENILPGINEAIRSFDKGDLAYISGNIFLRHLKEFQRTLKHRDKDESKITQIYRYSFTTTSNDDYSHELTKNLLINFIHWELWNSLPCQLVMSVISRKISDLIGNLSDPDIINYYILKFVLLEKERVRLNFEKYSKVRIELVKSKVEMKPEVLEEIAEELEVESKKAVKELEASREPSVEYKDSVKGSDSKLKESEGTKKETAVCDLVKTSYPSSTETWGRWLDFDAISIGEDPFSSSKYYESAFEADSKHSAPGTVVTTHTTLNEPKAVQENTLSTMVKPVSQATSQALHKIGDLQDEASGMVEGLFDMGLAGIRKGLKLTGLQDSSTQEGTLPENKTKLLLKSPMFKQSHSASPKITKKTSSAEIADESVWMNGDYNLWEQIPSIMLESSEYESPDLEYEEAADLATSIAKLRLLLQQKSSESVTTTPVASPMAPEEKTAMELDEIDSFVPSFYKLCAKTATGVFNNTLNSIKTALPVNPDEVLIYDIEKWNYTDVQRKDTDLLTRMYKLLHDRNDFRTIEQAFDALDVSDTSKPDRKIQVSALNIQDELDEFECRVPLSKTIVDIICELTSGHDTFINKEPLVKFILLVLGQFIDGMIPGKVEEFLKTVCSLDINVEQSDECLKMDFDVFVEYLMAFIPDAVVLIMGDSVLKQALYTLVLSLQIKKCNRDMILQLFEFICVRVKESSSHS